MRIHQFLEPFHTFFFPVCAQIGPSATRKGTYLSLAKVSIPPLFHISRTSRNLAQTHDLSVFIKHQERGTNAIELRTSSSLIYCSFKMSRNSFSRHVGCSRQSSPLLTPSCTGYKASIVSQSFSPSPSPVRSDSIIEGKRFP